MITLILGLLAARLDASAQTPLKVARVGYLEPGVAVGTPFFEAFREGLRDLGWVEGQNVALEVRAAGGKYERLRELAAELVQLKVDVIFASSTPAAEAASSGRLWPPWRLWYAGGPARGVPAAPGGAGHDPHARGVPDGG